MTSSPSQTTGRPQEYEASVFVAALKETKNVDQAARLIGCSGAIINQRAKTDGVIQKALFEQAETREIEIGNALIETRGILSKAADLVGLDSGAAVRYHITRSPRLKALFQSVREKVVDVAEDNVFTAVENGDLSYSWKLLQTLGKERGYIERKETDTTVTHSLNTQSTKSLIALLDQHAEASNAAIEAEFEVLPDADRELLSKALSRNNSPVKE